MKFATLNEKYATYHVKFTTSTSNMEQTRIFWNIVGYTTTNVKHETCNTSCEIYDLSRQVRNINVKHETNENIPEYSLFWLYPKLATSDVKHEIKTSDMQ